MRIGIDISQTAYEGTGVAEYVENLVKNLISKDNVNEYVLFFSSMRRNLKFQISNLEHTHKNLKIKRFRIPPSILDLFWNRLHLVPIESLIGDVDVFISSDWTQPPTKRAKMITIIYDLIVYKFPKETANKIVETQKRRLNWVRKECDTVICISESTKRDVIEVLGIEESRLGVVYPGIEGVNYVNRN